MESNKQNPANVQSELAELVCGVVEGRVSRRSFVQRGLALGLSSSVLGTLFATYRAGRASASGSSVTGNALTRHQDNATPVPGGSFHFARAEDSVNLDPPKTFYNSDIWVLLNVYEQLVRVAPNGVELEPALAESWEISTDALTYTFHLRSGVKFHDGTDLKASDVKYSVERAKNDPTKTWTFTLTALGTVEAPDDSTVVMKLNQPWAPFLADLAMFSTSIMPEAWAKANEADLPSKMMGTGPFLHAEWKKGEYVLLKKFDSYWDPQFPFLDEIKISQVPDDNSRILQLQGGEIDGMTDVPTSRVEELNASDLQVLQFPSSYSQYIPLHHKKAPLDDVNARLALEYATDKQTLIQVVLFGNGTEATTFMPKGALFWNDELEGFPYDLDKAKEYLAKSKTPEGFAIELQFLAGSAELEQLCTAIKDMWSQINVEVSVAPTEQSIFNANFQNETFQAQASYWTNDIIDPDELVAFAIEPESADAFHTGWSNAEAVDLAAKGRAEQDPEKRKAMYFRIQELFNQDAVMVLLYHKPYMDAVSRKVHGFAQPPTGQWVWKGTWKEA